MSEKKHQKPHLPVRLNILFFLVFLLFSALILRLGVVQIVQGESFQEELERTVNISQPVEAPRGMIYDRYGNTLVGNELLFTVTFTNRRTSSAEMVETARKLNEFITMPLEIEEVRERFVAERKDFWTILNEEEYQEKLTVEEASERDLSDSEAHAERMELITDEELDQLTDEELEVFLIWREFIRGYNNLPHKVLRGVEYVEAAQIMEHMDNLPGIDIIRDSTRVYQYNDTLRSIFGSVGSIPREELDSFLSKGYERNEEVGQSYLEAQYESVLRGRKGERDNFVDPDGNLLSNPDEKQGSRGNDLVLTLDMELQQHVEEVIKTEVNSSAARFIGDKNAYVVIMDPNTGDILSMSNNTENDNSSDLDTFQKAYEVGSSMKGATVLAGFDTGVMSPGQVIIDRPLSFQGSRDISSVSNLGPVDDLSALERSSNVYMVEVAMRLIGYNYGMGGKLPNASSGYDILRSYYSQFGLGVHTGIDLPNEFKGINGGDITENYLFLSFGQFDTYTPMQLAQYVSTIANDGYRIAPKVVKEIREPNMPKDEIGGLSQQIEPKILNYLDVDDNHMSRVQQGFRRVIRGNQGTANSYFQGRDYDPAGKTGTAQVTVDGQYANNQTFVGYAPYDNPEVAISVVVPGTADIDSSGVAMRIAEGSLDAYFELKESRIGPEMPEDGVDIDEVGDGVSD
ncbi:penicillin-binding transpeptidase domain-containing protein [Salipaludibacillus sp. HK11]|uniref:penicillin-binding transpeptidase domain-containing protein n=1 Tax=Salipaludibacillus sp. HK11 TaxID=3394320 RepID=UPI0039FBD462